MKGARSKDLLDGFAEARRTLAQASVGLSPLSGAETDEDPSQGHGRSNGSYDADTAHERTFMVLDSV
jgi:hypothetical protein